MTVTFDAAPATLAISDETADLLFREAHTANAFTDEPVPLSLIEQVYDLIKWGPTSANFQPLRLMLVQSPAARERLVSLMDEGNRSRVAAAPVVMIVAADVNFHEHLDRLYPVWPGAREALEGAPRVQIAESQAWLQMGYLIAGIRAAGLAAGPMGGFNKEAVNAEFFPEGDRVALAVINVGYPAVDAYRPRHPRLEFSEAVSLV